ncbi:MAG: hypothetical protein GX046_00220 [Tissierellia bacterium]|nr:hypothetical protein [Tissierellia bacterium]
MFTHFDYNQLTILDNKSKIDLGMTKNFGENMEFEDYKAILRRKLTSTYDLSDNYEINGLFFDLYGNYHMRTERYLATKKAVVYGMENNDYLFVKHHEDLNPVDLANYLTWTKESLKLIVFPHREHMSSTITLVCVVENDLDEELIKQIRKSKYHRGFSLGFKGWFDLRLAVYSLKNHSLVTNKKGREVKGLFL